MGRSEFQGRNRAKIIYLSADFHLLTSHKLTREYPRIIILGAGKEKISCPRTQGKRACEKEGCTKTVEQKAGSPGPGVMLPYPRFLRLLFSFKTSSYRITLVDSLDPRSKIVPTRRSTWRPPVTRKRRTTHKLAKFSKRTEQTFLGRLFREDKRKRATTFLPDKSVYFHCLTVRGKDRSFKEPSVISPFANNLGARRLWQAVQVFAYLVSVQTDRTLLSTRRSISRKILTVSKCAHYESNGWLASDH